MSVSKRNSVKMDLFKQITNVVSLNDYIELTQDVDTKHKDVKIAFNMSTILSLKKIRSLEIEHFNKCDGIGAAFKLLERMLGSPPSKTWALLGPEVIGLIQYWLDAVRKHLISHHINWWIFLKQILGFIKKIREKDHSLSSILVEEVAESMLDLATSGKLDVHQRYEILHTFNLFCADSSREIRLALKTQFEPHFIRLSTILATCGHLPAQLAALEALLRWLQPRHDPAARRDAAGKWFLPHLYPKAAVDVFLTRNWMNFFQDARDFLNSHNRTRDLVSSAACRKLCVGELVIITGGEKRLSWLDINSSSRTMTVTLEPQLLDALGVHVSTCETLLIHHDCVSRVTLHREAMLVTLSVSALSPPSIVPSLSRVLGSQPCDVTLVLSSRTPLPRVDAALRQVFQHKYQLMMDFQNMTITPSPEPAEGVRGKKFMEENTRFSHPAKEKRRKTQGGFVAWSKRFTALKSPSTASTASLAQLHDKLANLPYYEFTKEPVSVCALPELSIVNELNESQISNSLDSRGNIVLRRCAVRNFKAHIEDRKSQSDGEVRSKHDDDTENNADDHRIKSSHSDKYVNKTARVAETDVSSLFAATIGSADNSIINATIERFPKDKEINTDNLIDLLVQEALQPKANEEIDLSDRINAESGKKVQEQNNQDTETIEDTQYAGLLNIKTTGLRNFVKTPKNKVILKSTSDESNTEAIVETPISYVSVRRKHQRKTSKKSEANVPDENVIVDVATVENFFSQHFAENQMGDVIISPTLAKKINESSSESSDDLLLKNIDDNFDIRNEEIPDFDIVECLNDIVDKVCSDFEKCSEYLGKQSAATEILNMAKNFNTQAKKSSPLAEKVSPSDETAEKQNENPSKNTKPKKKQTIKLKFPSNKAKPKSKAKGKLKLEPVSKMSIILENNESDGNKTSSSDTKKIDLTESVKKTPLARRKRKLYSPKDDQIQFDKSNKDISSSKSDPVLSDNEDEISLAALKKEKLVTPKSTASCYKEIEKERKRIRNRKSKNKESPVSLRAKKLDDVFEKLKDNIEIHENEKITLVDKKSDKDVYNFTSDSEDEDFKEKKKEIQKRTSTTTIGSGTSVISTRRGRARNKVKYTEDEKESANESSKPNKRKRATRRKVSKTKSIKSTDIKINRPTDLVDEKMRDAAPEIFNSSFVAANVDNNIKEPIPSVHPPELEVISDENANIDVEDCRQKTLQNEKLSDKTATKIGKSSAKEEKKTTKEKTRHKITKINAHHEIKKVIKDDDGTVSPLPCLVVENEVGKNKLDDSLTTNFMQKIQKVYKDGPDALNDTTATQNMLSDNEKAISPRTNITDELCKLFEDKTSNDSKKGKNFEDKENSDVNVIDDSIHSDQMSMTSKTKKRHNLRLKCKDKTDSSINNNIVKKHDIIKKDKIVITTKINNTESQHVLNDSQKSRNKSQIDDINYDEIISIAQYQTRSKAKSRSISKETEIINKTADSEEKSERSISTDGITGHGDTNELPPSPKLLSEKLTPREIEDMDATIRQYYIELSNKVNISNGSDKIPNQNKDERIKNKTIEKIIEEDDAYEPRSVAHTSVKEQMRAFFEDGDYYIRKMLPSRRESSESSSNKSQKSPVVSIGRLSPKEMAKWLPSATSTPESSFKSTQKTRETPRRSIRIAKSISHNTTPESNYNTAKKSKETNKTSPKATRYRKSQISPVELDDFMPKRKILPKDTTNSTNKDETIETQDVETISKLDSIAKNYFMRPTHESSPISRDEKSEQSTPRTAAPKRKTTVAKARGIKRRKLDEEFRMDDIKLSRRSSNVEDWLKNISSISRVDNVDATDEALQNLMEKLDTTLEEIHQNTTKDFIGLFVEAQQQLVSLREERRRSYRETAVDILSNVTQLLDRHFAELDQRAKERENSFMSWLRGRAGSLLRRDCSHKQAMVALLREDARAAARLAPPGPISGHTAGPSKQGSG